MKCVNAIDLHAKEDVLTHLLSNINYMKIVVIVYTKYALVAVMNSIITVIVCVLIVEHKWVIRLVTRQEVADSAALEGGALVDLVGLGENVSVDSGILIDLVFHSLFYHLTLMMRIFKRVILKHVCRQRRGKLLQIM